MEVPVYLERTPNSLKPFVLFEKTGSNNQNGVYTTMVAVQSYGLSMFEAAELNENVKRVMLEMPNYCDVSKVRLNSDYNYTNTLTNEYRYQAVFEITNIGG